MKGYNGKKMLKAEKKIIEYVQSHIYVLTFIMVTLLGLCIRISLRYMKSEDALRYLLPWYETIKENGGIRSLGIQVGDYNLLYQFLIAVMTYLPIPALYAYKGLSVIFDFLLAILAGRILYDEADDRRYVKALTGYSAVVLSPIVFLNSSAWAQCDSIYVFFMLLSIYCLTKDYTRRAFIFLGAAFAFKLQAVFLLPFFCYVYFTKKKFSILNFLFIPFTMCAAGIPAYFFGRTPLDIFMIYKGQSGGNPIIAGGYPSFWTIIAGGDLIQGYVSMKNAALLVTVSALLLWMVALNIKKVEMNTRNMIYTAFILAYTMVLFLPAMHERYGYLCEIIAIIILVYNRKTLLPMLLMYIITLITYGSYLFGTAFDATVILSAANIIVYALYSVILIKDMRKTNSGEDTDVRRKNR
jgi:Gpi18-like mannosyltransferase